MESRSLEFRPFPWALKHPHIAGPWTSFPARSWCSVARVRYKSWVRVDPRSMHKPCMPACVAFPSSRFVQVTTLYNLIQLPNWWTIPAFPLMPPALIHLMNMTSVWFWHILALSPTEWSIVASTSDMKRISNQSMISTVNIRFHQSSSKYNGRTNFVSDWTFSKGFNFHLNGGWCFFALRTARSHLTLLN